MTTESENTQHNNQLVREGFYFFVRRNINVSWLYMLLVVEIGSTNFDTKVNQCLGRESLGDPQN